MERGPNTDFFPCFIRVPSVATNCHLCVSWFVGRPFVCQAISKLSQAFPLFPAPPNAAKRFPNLPNPLLIGFALNAWLFPERYRIAGQNVFRAFRRRAQHSTRPAHCRPNGTGWVHSPKSVQFCAVLCNPADASLNARSTSPPGRRFRLQPYKDNAMPRHERRLLAVGLRSVRLGGLSTSDAIRQQANGRRAQQCEGRRFRNDGKIAAAVVDDRPRLLVRQIDTPASDEIVHRIAERKLFCQEALGDEVAAGDRRRFPAAGPRRSGQSRRSSNCR